MSRRYSVVTSAWCLVLAAVTPLSAQSAEDAARAAEQAGQYRQAFTLYMARWKEVTADYDRSQSPAASQAIERIRDAIFNVIRNVDPPPAVPDEATAFEGRAEAANNVRDYADAAEAYRQAIRAAPWVPRLYYNRAVVLERTGDTQGTIAHLTHYIHAAPGADDATDVKKKIAGLQYLVEKEAREKAADQAAETQRQQAAEQARRAAQQAVQQVISGVSGTWVANAGNRFQYAVTSDGRSIQLVWTDVDWGQGWKKAQSTTTFIGSFDGLQISGQYTIENARNISSRGDGTYLTGTFAGRVNPDGRTMTISYPYKGYTTGLTLTR